MSTLTPEIFAFAARFRAELSPRNGLEEILIDGLVATAVRLKRLYADPRAHEAFDNDEWDRVHDLTSRAFFRHYDRLERRRRAPAEAQSKTPKPARALPAELELNRPAAAPTPKLSPTPPAPFLPFTGRECAEPHNDLPAESAPPPAAQQPAAAQPAPTQPTNTQAQPGSARRRPDPQQLLRRERERRKRERREHRANQHVHPIGIPAASATRASPAA